MGRDSWSDRQTVEQCLGLNIFKLREWDYLCGFRSGSIVWKNALGEVTDRISITVSVSHEGYGENHVRVSYNLTDRFTEKKKKELDYKIELVSTACRFGGQRFWFICPLWRDGENCGRRVAKLYLPGNATYFGCRHCHNLTYRSCKEHDRRVSALMKLPPRELEKLVDDKDPKATLLAMKALFKMFGNK